MRKFASNAAFGGWAKERAERLLEFCETLEDSKDLSALARDLEEAFGGPGGRTR